MNAFTLLFAQLIGYILVILIISYAFGLILGGGKPDRANKVIAWELKQLAKFSQWTLGHLFHAIGNLFHWVAKECGHKKKNTKKP